MVVCTVLIEHHRFIRRFDDAAFAGISTDLKSLVVLNWCFGILLVFKVALQIDFFGLPIDLIYILAKSRPDPC